MENGEGIYSLLVMIDAREEYLLRILLDAESLPIDASWRQKECTDAGARLTTEYVDETWRVTFGARGEKNAQREAQAGAIAGKEAES